jgi:GAF domain-containing protein
MHDWCRKEAGAMDSNQTQISSGGDTADLTDNFAETARLLFSAGGVTDTLTEVVKLSVTTIEGCDFAGLFLLDGVAVTTPTRTDPVVDLIDGYQHESGEGPCLDAISEGSIFYANDLDSESRWPHFAPRAGQAGIRSVLALPVAQNNSLGALNLYARSPIAFGVVDRGKGVILASLAGLALAAAHSQEQDGMGVEDFRAALGSRELIGQAEGILMERERISSDHAFDILRRASQHLNVKLREVAQTLVDTGESPDTGVPRVTSQRPD